MNFNEIISIFLSIKPNMLNLPLHGETKQKYECLSILS